jgi:hypothetical protein
MKKKSIYTNQSQELLHLFEDAGNSSKIMCVPMDYAKKDHVVMLCNGYGRILRKPFSVKNSPEGVKYLTDQVSRSCRKRRIKLNHVFFGGEDVNSYAENFVNTLRAKGWLVAGVNAHDAKEQRANLQASTDRIDLMGIASMLLNRRANCSPAQSGIYRNMRTLIRHRRKLVAMSTTVRNQVHTVVDRLFPGFLDEKKSGIVPFTNSSLYLMETRFSAPQMARRKKDKLIEILRRYSTSKPEQTAAQLQDLVLESYWQPVSRQRSEIPISRNRSITWFPMQALSPGSNKPVVLRVTPLPVKWPSAAIVFLKTMSPGPHFIWACMVRKI